MRLLVAVLLLFMSVESVLAKRLQLTAQGSTGLTYNDNITLSKADVNFGPGVLARKDLLGHVRMRTALKLDDTTELAYTGTRTRFYENEDLGFVENILDLTHDQLFPRQALLQVQAQLARVDPDELVRPDGTGVFPFTTSEPPDRQVLQAILSTPPGRPTEVAVRALAQDQQYSNNPLLDSDARALQLRVGQKLGEKWNVGAEEQRVDRDYPNLVGPTPGSQIETDVTHRAVQAAYTPNKHFGFLAKSLWLNQYANVDAFFLDQEDLSFAASWDDERWGNAALLAQRSRRVFDRRLTPEGGPQVDRDWLLVLQVAKRLGLRSTAIFGYTYDRNRSNVSDFDYSNNVVRFELVRLF